MQGISSLCTSRLARRKAVQALQLSQKEARRERDNACRLQVDKDRVEVERRNLAARVSRLNGKVLAMEEDNAALRRRLNNNNNSLFPSDLHGVGKGKGSSRAPRGKKSKVPAGFPPGDEGEGGGVGAGGDNDAGEEEA